MARARRSEAGGEGRGGDEHAYSPTPKLTQWWDFKDLCAAGIFVEAGGVAGLYVFSRWSP